jgi:hypothetical protein
MSRRQRWLVAIVVAAAAIWLVALLRPSNEPRYKGFTVTQWVEVTPDESRRLLGHFNPSEAAIQQLGTNALPWLILNLECPDSQLASGWLKIYLRLPRRIRAILPEPVLPAVRRVKAAKLLPVLGADAAPAIPILINMATNDPGSGALSALGELGPMASNAIPMLKVLAGHTNRSIALGARQSLWLILHPDGVPWSSRLPNHAQK